MLIYLVVLFITMPPTQEDMAKQVIMEASIVVLVVMNSHLMLIAGMLQDILCPLIVQSIYPC